MFRKVTLSSALIFFLPKMLALLTSQFFFFFFFLPLIWNRWWVAWSRMLTFLFCGQTETFRYETVLSGIQPCFLHGGALWFWTNQGSVGFEEISGTFFTLWSRKLFIFIFILSNIYSGVPSSAMLVWMGPWSDEKKKTTTTQKTITDKKKIRTTKYSESFGGSIWLGSKVPF